MPIAPTRAVMPPPGVLPARARDTAAVHPPSGPPAAATAPTTTRPDAADGVLAIGDSVMIDVEPSLESQILGITVDASISRQVSDGISSLQAAARGGQLGRAVVFGLGTNGYFTSAQLVSILQVLAGRHLVVVTAHCPSCGWVAENNAMIDVGCTPARNCSIADFDALAGRNPGWFDGDGVHMPLGGPGARAYAQLVAARL